MPSVILLKSGPGRMRRLCRRFERPRIPGETPGEPPSLAQGLTACCLRESDALLLLLLLLLFLVDACRCGRPQGAEEARTSSEHQEDPVASFPRGLLHVGLRSLLR